MGGITAALVLRDQGWDVHVFERSASTLTSRGAGIVVQPATIRYFLENRVVEVERVSTSVRCVRFLARDGALAGEQPWSYRFTAWNTLYRTLLRCLEPERYHLGEALVRLEQDANQVEVWLSSGRRQVCELLVSTVSAWALKVLMLNYCIH